MNTIQEAMVRAEAKKAGLAKKREVKVVDLKPAGGLTLRVPKINKVEFLVAEQEVISKAVTDARQYLADIPDHMAGLVARIRGIRATSPEEQAIRSSEFKVLEDEVIAHLEVEDELLGGAARQAFAMAMVSTLPPDKRVVMDTIKGNSSRLPGLLGLKVLELAVGGAKNAVTVKVYGETYKVNGGRDFATKLVENLSAGATRAAKAAHEFYHGEVEAFKAQATISVPEMMRERKSGHFFLEVPDLKEDGGKFLPGGALLAESDGRMIKVLQACGHFQRIMTEIAEAGAFVPIVSLSHERLELTKRLSEDAFRRVRILHAVLRRGIAEAQKEA
jgi:hypothetical protein